jgi:hypothetical protein
MMRNRRNSRHFGPLARTRWVRPHGWGPKTRCQRTLPYNPRYQPLSTRNFAGLFGFLMFNDRFDLPDRYGRSPRCDHCEPMPSRPNLQPAKRRIRSPNRYADFFNGARVSPLRSHSLNSATLIGVIFIIRFAPAPSEKLLQ